MININFLLIVSITCHCKLIQVFQLEAESAEFVKQAVEGPGPSSQSSSSSTPSTRRLLGRVSELTLNLKFERPQNTTGIGELENLTRNLNKFKLNVTVTYVHGPPVRGSDRSRFFLFYLLKLFGIVHISARVLPVSSR